jgi:hypothetical protein
MKTSGLFCGQIVDFFFYFTGERPFFFFEKLLYKVLEIGGGGDFWRSHLPKMNVVS